MPASNDLATNIINHFFRNSAVTSPTNLYLALFTVAPDIDGAGGTEVTGGSYARQALTFAAPDSDNMAATSADTVFTGMPATTVVAGAIYTASSGGTFYSRALFTSPQVITAGYTFRLKAGLITVRVA